MQVSKWGNSLAVRLPAALIQELGLKPGDEVEVVPRRDKGSRIGLEVARKPTRAEIIGELGKIRWPLPADFTFDREDANRRN